MPQLQFTQHIDASPQKFVDACSESELHEVILLANIRLNKMYPETEQKESEVKSILDENFEMQYGRK